MNMWQLIVDVPGEGPSRKYFCERQKAEDHIKQHVPVGTGFALFTPQRRCVWSGIREERGVRVITDIKV